MNFFPEARGCMSPSLRSGPALSGPHGGVLLDQTKPRPIRLPDQPCSASGRQRTGTTGRTRHVPRRLAGPLRMLAQSACGRARMRVFVTGRSTALGNAVISELLVRGHSVTVLGADHRDNLKGVVTLLSDIAQVRVMRAVARQTDAIIHCDRPDPGTAKSAADALCGMLAALPPQGRLISASGAVFPDCPETIEINKAILAASDGMAQSAYVLVPAPTGRARTGCPGQQFPHILRANDRNSASRPGAMFVEDCARLLACLVENGALKGGPIFCPPLAAPNPDTPVHAAWPGFGAPQNPAVFGFDAFPDRAAPGSGPRECTTGTQRQHPAKTPKQGQAREIAFDRWSMPSGGVQ